jgi:hypothetical protein
VILEINLDYLEMYITNIRTKPKLKLCIPALQNKENTKKKQSKNINGVSICN